MGNTCSINLPWPKDFPAEPYKLCRLASRPESITDVAAFDLHYENECEKTIDDTNLGTILSTESSASILPFPESINAANGFEYYQFKSSDGSTVNIQTKYYNYFIQKYGGCEFLFSSLYNPVLVRYNKEIVGAVMSILV